MTWREKLDRKQRERRQAFRAGRVMSNGVSTWGRTAWISVPIVAVFVGSFLFLEEERTRQIAVLAFASQSMFTWLMVERLPVAGFTALHAIFTLGACFVATGLTTRLVCARLLERKPEVPEVLAALRLVGFGVLVAAALCGAKFVVMTLATTDDFSAIGVYLAILTPFFEVWLAAIYWLVIPVLAIENVSLRGALLRSRTLTRGSRPQIAVVLSVYVLLTTFVLLTHPGAWSYDPGAAHGMAAIAVIATTLLAAFLAEGYTALRLVKEGAAPEAVARVFD